MRAQSCLLLMNRSCEAVQRSKHSAEPEDRDSGREVSYDDSSAESGGGLYGDASTESVWWTGGQHHGHIPGSPVC